MAPAIRLTRGYGRSVAEAGAGDWLRGGVLGQGRAVTINTVAVWRPKAMTLTGQETAPRLQEPVDSPPASTPVRGCGRSGTGVSDSRVGQPVPPGALRRVATVGQDYPISAERDCNSGVLEEHMRAGQFPPEPADSGIPWPLA